MFDKAKQLFELQGKAKKLQGILRELEFSGIELGGKIKVTVSGDQKVTAIEIDDSFMTPDEKTSLIKFLVQATNSAIKRAQQTAATKTKEIMGGLGIPGL